jgi:hypothetical protein
MGSLLRTPVSYGFRDVTFNSEQQRRARIYFPSPVPKKRIYFPWPFSRAGIHFAKVDPASADILVGDYSLIVFVHGDRSSSPGMCPGDWSEDFTRWGAVLQLLARCGFVVAVPDVSGTISTGNENTATEQTAAVVTELMHWMYESWEHRDMLLTVLGTPSYPMGLAGHSWGALVCARLAGDPHFAPKAVATISGTWTSEGSKRELIDAAIPLLFMNGTSDAPMFAQPSMQPYPEAGLPKHQMALQQGQHWDWFPPGQDIYPCSGTPQDRCTQGWRAASELCLTFFTKYLYNQWFLARYLLTSPQRDRGDVLDHFQEGGSCAMKIRWSTNEADDGGGFGPTDEVTLGPWVGGSPW